MFAREDSRRGRPLARVGSTNLNISSWVGNYELDVAIEDERLAQTMERMYREDLANAVEIVLSPKRKVRPGRELRRVRLQGSRGSSGRAAAGALRLANSIGAAMTDQRLLGPAEPRSWVRRVRLLAIARFCILAQVDCHSPCGPCRLAGGHVPGEGVASETPWPKRFGIKREREEGALASLRPRVYPKNGTMSDNLRALNTMS